MSLNATETLRNAMATAIGTALTGGKIYIYSGTAPVDANTALSLGATHTELAIISDDGGSGGLTFETAAVGVLAKESTQTWREDNATFDGFDTATTTQTPTFFRFCEDGDNGRGVGTGLARIQGTVGGPSSSADLQLAETTITDGDPVVVGAASFTVA